MSEMKLEELTQGFIYVLELEPESQIPDDIDLMDMKPFLRSIDDISLIDKLIKYEAPHLFTILRFEDGVSFLHITVFAGKIKKGADLAPLNLLSPYFKFLYEGSRIPYLPTLLFNGAFFQTKVLDFHAKANIYKIFKAALYCEDIYVIYGRPGAEKDEVIKNIINNITGFHEESWSIEDYKKRIFMHNRPDYKLLVSVDNLKTNFSSFINTYSSALKALESVYEHTLPVLSGESLQVLNKWMDVLRVGPRNSSPDVGRLLKNIYALPQNEIIYEDNGEFVINEAIDRLEKFYDFDLVRDDVEQLKALAETYDGTDEWFSILKTIRRRLMISLTPEKNDYLSESLKNEINDLFDRIIKELKNYIENAHKEKNEILSDYIAEINQETLNKYTKKMDFSQPVMYKGIAVIDTDACLNEETIMESAVKADKIIMLGSYMEGLFRLFFNAALCQENKDGKERLAFLDPNNNRHPKLSEYINKTFCELRSMPFIKDSEPESDEYPIFIWLTPESEIMSFEGHVYEMAKKGLSVGVLAFNKDDMNEISHKLEGLNLKNVQAGTETDFYNKEFDALYLFITKGEITNKRLYSAMSKGTKLLAVVGSLELSKEAPLNDFYYRCIGDEIYGRLYN